MTMGAKNKSLFRSIGTLSAGSIAGYMCVFVLTPLLTRVYSPEQLGKYAVFGAIVAVLPSLVSFSYHMGILSARTRGSALRYAFNSLSLTAYICGGLGGAILLVGIFGLISKDVAVLLVCAVISTWLAVGGAVNVNWAVRNGDESRAASSVFLAVGGRSVAQFFAGLIGGGAGGLVAGDMLSRAASWAAAERGISRQVFRWGRGRVFPVATGRRVDSAYPLVITPSVTIEGLLIWLPAPLFTIAFSAEIGGVVALVQRFTSIPITVINQSLGAVFHRQLVADSCGVRQYVGPRLPVILISAFMATSIISIVAVEFGAVAGSALLGGDQWSAVAVVAGGLSWVCTAQVFAVFAERLLMVLGKSVWKLWWACIGVVFLLGSVAIARLLGWDWQHAFMLFTVGQVLAYAGVCLSAIVLFRSASK